MLVVFEIGKVLCAGNLFQMMVEFCLSSSEFTLSIHREQVSQLYLGSFLVVSQLSNDIFRKRSCCLSARGVSCFTVSLKKEYKAEETKESA